MPGRPIIAALVLLLSQATIAQQQEGNSFNWSGDIGIANGLVYRGLKLSEEPLVPNITIAVEHKTGFYLRSWLTRVELAGLFYESDSSLWQLFFDAGYRWQFHRDWSLAIAHSWYRYNQDLRERNPNYTEWAANMNYSAYLTLSYAHSEDLWGLDTRQDVANLSGRWPITRRFIGEAALGWVEQRYFTTENYLFLRLNAGYVYRHWSVQLQFHTTEGASSIYNPDRVGKQWVAQFTWHW